MQNVCPISLHCSHISDLKYINITLLDSLVKSKENTIEKLLAVAKCLSVLLFQYK